MASPSCTFPALRDNTTAPDFVARITPRSPQRASAHNESEPREFMRDVRSSLTFLCLSLLVTRAPFPHP